ncbi:MAG: type II and III secretion system protein family protein, partial [Alphaproteobacteria bacterium]
LFAKVGNFQFGVAQGGPTVLPGELFPGGTLRRGTGGANALYGLLSGSGIDLNSVVDALEDERLLTVLAEPNLTAMSGETASFLAGGEYPVPVPQDGGAISIEYKKFGVSLSFKPTVLTDGRINLSVTPEVSQLTEAGSVTLSGFVIPALSTRRAETTIELGSGQSFAIAGLLQASQDQTVSKFPGLGDLPVIGPLFRSDVFQRGETELVIIVTPYIVRPVSQQMALPTDGLVPPNDYERIFGNRAAFDSNQRMSNPHQRPENNRPGQRRLAGPYGFVLD